MFVFFVFVCVCTYVPLIRNLRKSAILISDVAQLTTTSSRWPVRSGRVVDPLFIISFLYFSLFTLEKCMMKISSNLRDRLLKNYIVMNE